MRTRRSLIEAVQRTREELREGSYSPIDPQDDMSDSYWNMALDVGNAILEGISDWLDGMGWKTVLLKNGAQNNAPVLACSGTFVEKSSGDTFEDLWFRMSSETSSQHFLKGEVTIDIGFGSFRRGSSYDGVTCPVTSSNRGADRAAKQAYYIVKENIEKIG